IVYYAFFFFQAEDGIRDDLVTGVQTCALPISNVIRQFGAQKKIAFVHFRDVRGTPEKFVEVFHDEGKTDLLACMRAYRDIGFDRSEERRVGKEWNTSWEAKE